MSDTVTLLSAANHKWKAGDLAEAERLWRAVLAADPANATAAKLLGDLLLDARRHLDAYAVVSVAARRKPFDVALRNLMGRCFQAIGHISAAQTIFETILQRDPSSVQAKVGLSLCATGNRKALEAAAMLRPLLPAHANDPFIHGALARAYVNLGQPGDAITHYRAALALRPAIGWRAEYAWALFTLSSMNEALAEFDAVLAMSPDMDMAIAGKAQVLIERGDRDQASRLLTEALERGTLDESILIAHGRLARTPEQRAVSRRFMERRLTATQGHTARIPLLFALGKIEEDDGNYDAAFACFRSANEMSGPGVTAEVAASSFVTIKTTFTKENLQRLPRNSQSDPLPVFIVGMPRSGTSLVEQILASHPDVYGAGELPDMNRIAIELPTLMQPPASGWFPGCVLSMTQSDIDRIAGQYLQMLHAKSGDAKVATDKMPWNLVYCGLIDLLFPGSKIIHCRRDPLDTCLSIYATSLGETHAYRNRLSGLAATYREYHALMAHWHKTLRVPILDVQYEDLVADPEAHARRLVEYVGLPWDDQCMKFYENRRSVGTASVDQVRRPIYNSSINRWRNYEKHLGPLIDGLRWLK